MKTLREKIEDLHPVCIWGGDKPRTLVDLVEVLRIVTEHERGELPLEKTGALPSGCQHENAKPGPRVPAVYGSFASEICPDCGQYRLGGTGAWKAGPPDLREREDY